MTSPPQDVDEVNVTLKNTLRRTDALSASVDKLTRELEEERSARRLLEKVLLKMAEEQTLKVVEQSMHKEKLARDAANKRLKDYVDMVYETVTQREREAVAERRVRKLLANNHELGMIENPEAGAPASAPWRRDRPALTRA